MRDQGGLVVVNPATGEPVTGLPIATKAQVDATVAAARKAAPEWATTPAAQRAQRLREAADDLDANAAGLAELATAEMGRPRAQSIEGVAAGVATLRQYAELATVHRGRSLAGAPFATDLMVHEPRGVVAVITPWNDPVAVSCGLIGAALATGNAVVHKPSERSPGTGVGLDDVLAKHFPPGVLSLLTGDGETGAHLAASEVDVVAHVGSSATGRRIAVAAAATGAKVLLENGGNDPMIVDAGVDPVWAAQQAALGAFVNAGQLCVAVERIYVHSAITEPFLSALIEAAQQFELGPLVDVAHRELVHRSVTDAVRGGAKLCCGGRIPAGPGAFYPATVLFDCASDMAVMSEETFGPVAPVAVADTFDQALELASATPYGLAATVLTASMANAQRAIRVLRAGTVKVNAVFGGAPGGAAHPRGISGQGFGYGPELLDEMTYTKVVHLEAPPSD